MGELHRNGCADGGKELGVSHAKEHRQPVPDRQ